MKKRKGKELCELLKSIRQKLADANGIKYEPHECHHEGDCRGTCPMCDGELEKLTDEISNMIDDGVEVNFDVLTDEEKEFLSMRWGVSEASDDEMILAGMPAPLPEDEILMGDAMVNLIDEDDEVWDGEPDSEESEEGMDRLGGIGGGKYAIHIMSDEEREEYRKSLHEVKGLLVNEDDEPMPLRIIKENGNTVGISKKDGSFTLTLEHMPTTVCLAACDGYAALEYDIKTEDDLKIVLYREK